MVQALLARAAVISFFSITTMLLIHQLLARQMLLLILKTTLMVFLVEMGALFCQTLCLRYVFSYSPHFLGSIYQGFFYFLDFVISTLRPFLNFINKVHALSPTISSNTLTCSVF